MCVGERAGDHKTRLGYYLDRIAKDMLLRDSLFMRERASAFACGGYSFQMTAASIEMQLHDGTIKQLCPNLQECGHGCHG